jgi:hypothetical protein
VQNGYQCSPDISHYWGQYSPYFTVPSEIDAGIPSGCSVSFVQMLSRHGARDPTASKTAKYNATVTAIHDAVTSYGPGFEFIEDYEYTLGADQLTTFGQQQLVNAGIKFYLRYEALARTNTPFFRSSSEDRVVESAQNWTQGFHQARVASGRADASLPYDILTISEDAGVNNTLSHSLCTSFEDGLYDDIKDGARANWTAVFLPNITQRLNENLPGANITADQTIYLMDLCPFNTVADTAGRISTWCLLFTDDEWQSYDYYETLDKWYGYGPGNPLGPTQGVGFANELIARLTNTTVDDHTSTNATLDAAGAATFPLGRALYADFSHDNDMTTIFAALGLYNATAPLPTTARESAAETGGYSASWTVPFAARMYVEKMTCDGSDEELVRILVNDRVVPLQNCGADDLGRCRLSAFVDSLGFVQSGGHWDQCFE